MGAGPVLVVLAVAAGAFAQSVSGFGFSLIATPACALLLGPWHGIRTAATMAVAVDALLLGRERRELDLVALGRMLGPAAAVVPAAVVLSLLAPGALLVALAATATLAVVGLMSTRRIPALAPGAAGGRDWRWAGMASSVMGVTAGMAGPPVALQALRSGRPVTESRATLAAFFLVVDLAAVLARGAMVPDRSTVALLAAGAVGWAAGGVASRHLPDPLVRSSVLLLAAAAAVAVLVQAVTT